MGWKPSVACARTEVVAANANKAALTKVYCIIATVYFCFP
jgi:hypothetical protein